MRHALVRFSFALASAAVVAACTEVSIGTGPRTVAERVYVLHSIAGAPLPYVEDATPAGDTLTLLNATLVLGTSGRATRTQTVRQVVGGVATIVAQSSQWSYAVTGDRIDLVPICPAGALCIRGDSGTITDAQVTLTTLDVPGAPVYLYTRALDL